MSSELQLLIIIVFGGVGLYYLAKYVFINLSPLVLNIIKLVFVFVALFVFYLNYNSIDSKIELTQAIKDRNAIVQKRLEQIRDAEVEYKKVKGEYAGNFKQLKDFLLNDSIPTVKMIGSIPDSLVGQESRAIALGIISRDTTLDPVRTVLFTHNFDAVVDSINYIPFAGGKEFTLAADEIEKGKVKVKVFEAKASYKDIYSGLAINNEGVNVNLFMAIGSLTDPTLNGNWK